MENTDKTTSKEMVNSYIQPSLDIPGQPAHVVQDGWIAYLPSGKYARPSFNNDGRGFFKGYTQKYSYGKKSGI